MRCKRCKMECSENELVNGLCETCQEFAKNESSKKRIINKVADNLGLWKILFWLIGLLACIYLISVNLIAYGIIALVSNIFIATLLGGFAEIIQLLEDIKNK